jgi:hypothetical protein
MSSVAVATNEVQKIGIIPHAKKPEKRKMADLVIGHDLILDQIIVGQIRSDHGSDPCKWI